MRQYSEESVHPDISFDKDCKSLLVIGSHADRRGIQKKAREAGLKVFYVDPEGFIEEDGSFIHYPLESPQSRDVLWRGTADQFSVEMSKYF